MKKEIDALFNNQDVKDKFKCRNWKTFRLAVKSYMRNHPTLVNEMISRYHNADCLRAYINLTLKWFKEDEEEVYRFRNIDFQTKDLIEQFIDTYTKQLIGTNKEYFDKLGLIEWSKVVFGED